MKFITYFYFAVLSKHEFIAYIEYGRAPSAGLASYVDLFGNRTSVILSVSEMLISLYFLPKA